MSSTHITLPSKVKVVQEDGAHGVYEIEGLAPGYGYTLGNSLRRIILSSMPGAAITSLKVEGASHEFMTVPGVREDVVTMILNLKKVRFHLSGDLPQTATLSVKKGIAKASDFSTSGSLEVLNGDQYIAEVADKGKGLTIEVTVERGMGFIPREALKKEKADVGSIFVDAIFSPIRRVSYEVENMRVGDRTDFNRLRMTIETDGSIPARESFESSVKIMVEQLRTIIDLKESVDRREAPMEKGAHLKSGSDEKSGGDDAGEKEPSGDITEILKTRIDSLQLSTRTLNSLSSGGIRTLGGLVQKTAEDLLDLEGFGEKGLAEIKELLTSFNLALRD